MVLDSSWFWFISRSCIDQRILHLSRYSLYFIRHYSECIVLTKLDFSYVYYAPPLVLGLFEHNEPECYDVMIFDDCSSLPLLHPITLAIFGDSAPYFWTHPYHVKLFVFPSNHMISYDIICMYVCIYTVYIYICHHYIRDLPYSTIPSLFLTRSDVFLVIIAY